MSLQTASPVPYTDPWDKKLLCWQQLVSNVVLVSLFHINESTLWDPQKELQTHLIINIFMHNTQN